MHSQHTQSGQRERNVQAGGWHQRVKTLCLAGRDQISLAHTLTRAGDMKARDELSEPAQIGNTEKNKSLKSLKQSNKNITLDIIYWQQWFR